MYQDESNARRTVIVYEVCQSCGCDLWSDFEVSATLCVDCIDLANQFVHQFLTENMGA